MLFKLWTWTNALVYSPRLCFAPLEKFKGGNLLLGLLVCAGVPATWCITLFSILKRNILILLPSLIMFLHTGCLEALIYCLLEEWLLILYKFSCAGLEEKHLIQLLKYQPFLAYLSMAYTCVSDTALFTFSGTDLLHLNLRETQVAGYS